MPPPPLTDSSAAALQQRSGRPSPRPRSSGDLIDLSASTFRSRPPSRSNAYAPPYGRRTTSPFDRRPLPHRNDQRRMHAADHAWIIHSGQDGAQMQPVQMNSRLQSRQIDLRLQKGQFDQRLSSGRHDAQPQQGWVDPHNQPGQSDSRLLHNSGNAGTSHAAIGDMPRGERVI